MPDRLMVGAIHAPPHDGGAAWVTWPRSLRHSRQCLQWRSSCPGLEPRTPCERWRGALGPLGNVSGITGESWAAATVRSATASPFRQRFYQRPQCLTSGAGRMTNTKEWTDRDLQILHSLYSSGLGSVEIAERLGRTEEEITGGLSIARQRVGAPPEPSRSR